MGIGAALIGSAIIGGGASYLSSKKNADAAEEAADAQKEAAQSASAAQVDSTKLAIEAQERTAREALDFQKWAFEQTAARQEPWLQAGRQSLAKLQAGIASNQFTRGAEGVERSDPLIDPGYEFRRQEGQRAQERSAASRGNLLSGGQAKALQRWSQGLASQEYQNAWNRAEQQYLNDYNKELSLGQTKYNQLAGVAGTGQTAANQIGAAQGALGQSGSNTLNALGNNTAQGYYNQGNALATGYQNYGNAAAQGALNQGNAWSSGYQNIAGSAQNALGNYAFLSFLGAK